MQFCCQIFTLSRQELIPNRIESTLELGGVVIALGQFSAQLLHVVGVFLKGSSALSGQALDLEFVFTLLRSELAFGRLLMGSKLPFTLLAGRCSREFAGCKLDLLDDVRQTLWRNVFRVGAGRTH